MKKELPKPPVSHPPSFVAQIILECHGHTRLAAHKLKMTPATVRNYIKKYPECKDAWEEAVSDIVGQAEANLYEFVMDGDKPATFFVLKTLAKAKYNSVIQPEVNEDEGPLELNFVLAEDGNENTDN